MGKDLRYNLENNIEKTNRMKSFIETTLFVLGIRVITV